MYAHDCSVHILYWFATLYDNIMEYTTQVLVYKLQLHNNKSRYRVIVM